MIIAIWWYMVIYMGVSENVVYIPNPMVLLIIIPMKNGYFIGGIYPIFRHTHILPDRIARYCQILPVQVCLEQNCQMLPDLEGWRRQKWYKHGINNYGQPPCSSIRLGWRQQLQNFTEHLWKTTIKHYHLCTMLPSINHFHKCVSSPSSLSWGEQVEIHLRRSSADGQQFVLLWQILAGEQLLDLLSQWFKVC